MPKASTLTDAQNIKIETALREVAQLGEKGNLLQAQKICDRILSDFPDHPRALYYSGLTALQTGNHQKALELMEKVQEIAPNQPADFYQNLGIIYAGLNLFDKSIENLQLSLESNARSPNTHFNLALAYSKKGDTKFAIHHYEKTIALMPNYFTAHNSLGNIYQEQGQTEKALKYYNQAISINPRYAECFGNRAGLYKKIKSYSYAKKDYEMALSIKPDFIEARNNFGVLLMDMESYRAALEQFTILLKQNPYYLHTLKNAGDLSHKIEHYTDAVRYYRAGLKQEPDNLSFINSLMLTYKATADWSEEFHRLEKKQLRLIKNILQKKEKLELSPFSSLSMSFTDEEQLEIAANHAQHTFQSITSLPALYNKKIIQTQRLHIAYLSADFRDHPVAHLISGVLEAHNRKFDITAYYIGPALEADRYQQRIRLSVSRFIELGNKTDEVAAKLIAKDGVHILIDLMGYTQYARPEILAYRPAPVQIGFFGYPGTSGARFMDYYIVDKTVVPYFQSTFFSERLIYLPDVYLPTDNRMGIAKNVPSRSYYGLPEKDFVFCCFCNHYKLNSEVFEAWMKILKLVPNSVLWLFGSNELFEKNLKSYAEKLGIEKTRLVFAKKEPKEQHVARYQLADLFLDTFVYNAHATAIDALWAGLPLITYPGESMATRVSASLLTALNLTQLITSNIENYVELAVTLAKNSEQLTTIKNQLKWQRECSALFNTTRFTHHLENAFQLAWEHRDSQQQSLIVPALPNTLSPDCEKSFALFEETLSSPYSHRHFESTNNAGAITFWKNPSRSTNLLSTTEINNQNNFENEIYFDAEDEYFEETSLLWNSIKYAAQNGALRGASHVINYAMEKMCVEKKTSYTVSEALYYTSLFALRFYQQTFLSEDIFSAANHAFIETGFIFCTQFLSKAVEILGIKIKEQGKETIGNGLQTLGHYLNYAIYAKQFYLQEPKILAMQIAAGALAQTAVETTGKVCIDYFFKSHRSALQKNGNTFISVSEQDQEDPYSTPRNNF